MRSRSRQRRTKDSSGPSAGMQRPVSPAAMYLQLAADQHELAALEPSRSRRVLAIITAFTVACFIPLAAARSAAAHVKGHASHSRSAGFDLARKSDTMGEDEHHGANSDGNDNGDNATGAGGTGAGSNAGASGTQNATGANGSGAGSNAGASGTQNATGAGGSGAGSNAGASGTQNATGAGGSGAGSNAGASGTQQQGTTPQQGVAGANGTAPAVTPAQTAPTTAVKGTTKKHKRHHKKKHKKHVKATAISRKPTVSSGFTG